VFIHYELRQFLHKLAEVPDRVRIPSLAPNFHRIGAVPALALGTHPGRRPLKRPRPGFLPNSLLANAPSRIRRQPQKMFEESAGGWLKPKQQLTNLRVADAAATRGEGKKVDQVTRGSVTISVYGSENKVKVPIPEQPAEFELKVYESYITPFYEGRCRKTPRRSTREKVRNLAAQLATRLSQDGARAECLSPICFIDEGCAH
jgi:hypothetical protein